MGKSKHDGAAYSADPRRGMPRFISFAVLLGILLFVAVLSYMVMASFLLPMFLAILLGVIFRPMHVLFVEKCRGHDRVAAGLTTVAILLIVLLPTLLILVQASVEAYQLATEIGGQQVEGRLLELQREYNLQPLPKEIPANFAGMSSRIESLRDAAAQGEPPNDAADSVQFLHKEADAIRKQLNERASKLPADQVTDADRKRQENLAAAFTAFNKAVDGVQSAAPDGGQAFAAAVDQVETELQSLDHAVRGNAFQRMLRDQLSVDGNATEMIRERLSEVAAPLALGTGQYVGNFLVGAAVGLAVMIISLYYFLADGPGMVRTIMRLSPLDDRYEAQLVAEFGKVSRAVVVATLLSAFVQGLLASVGYFLCGFDNLFLLTVVTMLFAMIPFVGAASVWGACSIWLFYVEANTGAAIGLAIYGVLVVSMVDNLIKPMILHGQSNLHPLLALLSVLGGVKALGPIGIFVGPMVVAFLQALLNMLQTELAELGEPAADSSGRAAT